MADKDKVALPTSTEPYWWEWARCWCGRVPGVDCGHVTADNPDCGNADATSMWVVPDDVIRAMGSQPLTSGDRGWLDVCCQATNSLIRRFRPDLPLPLRSGKFSVQFGDQYDNQDGCMDPMVQYGAIQVALELYRRRGLTASESVPNFEGYGGPALSSLSLEAQLFLGLGRHHGPVLG